MELKSLMSGIGIVIDDAINIEAYRHGKDDEKGDSIVEILKRVEQEWSVPFYVANSLPREQTWGNLLQAASFVILDWNLWEFSAATLKETRIQENIRFLKRARDYFVPVLILTNEHSEDVIDKLPKRLYSKESPETSFIFIGQKIDLIDNDSLNYSAIERWIKKNASVYTLKTWERAFHIAKKQLFSSMYSKSVDWPRVFWRAYKQDGVDPNWSLTNLINDNLRSCMGSTLFEGEILDVSTSSVSKEDLRALICAASFLDGKYLIEDEIRCGDLFKVRKGKFLLNLRPDCDCVPRGDKSKIDDIFLYCVQGTKMTEPNVSKRYMDGHFDEKVFQSVVFSVYNGKSLEFNFKKLRLVKYSDLRCKRIGRVLHPYLTRIQQRYALYLQRQGLPRVPNEAVSRVP